MPVILRRRQLSPFDGKSSGRNTEGEMEEFPFFIPSEKSWVTEKEPIFSWIGYICLVISELILTSGTCLKRNCSMTGFYCLFLPPSQIICRYSDSWTVCCKSPLGKSRNGKNSFFPRWLFLIWACLSQCEISKGQEKGIRKRKRLFQWHLWNFFLDQDLLLLLSFFSAARC